MIAGEARDDLSVNPGSGGANAYAIQCRRGQIVEKNCCLYWFASAKRARFSSVDLRPFSWSSGRIPSGTPSQRTVTLVPCSEFSNTHVMLISPRNSVLSVLKLTDCSI